MLNSGLFHYHLLSAYNWLLTDDRFICDVADSCCLCVIWACMFITVWTGMRWLQSSTVKHYYYFTPVLNSHGGYKLLLLLIDLFITIIKLLLLLLFNPRQIW